jgi:hypothetical protein
LFASDKNKDYNSVHDLHERHNRYVQEYAHIEIVHNVHGSVHRKNIIIYTSNKMQRYTVYLYLETALHVSGGTSTHHQERIQLYLQHLVFVTTPLLLPAAI